MSSGRQQRSAARDAGWRGARRGVRTTGACTLPEAGWSITRQPIRHAAERAAGIVPQRDHVSGPEVAENAEACFGKAVHLRSPVADA
jgi:hypothetical protein